MSDPWETVVEPPPPSPRGFSQGAIVALAAALVVLAVAGLAIGWFVAGEDAGPNVAQRQTPGPSPAVQVSVTPSAEPATATPTASAAPATAIPGKVMPDLTKVDFRQARSQAIALKLGVTVVFGEQEAAGVLPGQVVRTNPGVGAGISSGINVKLFVVGPAPTFPLPDVTGQPCDSAKITMGNAGLRIGKYPTGRLGTAQSTGPIAGATVAWGDLVDIFCAANSPSTPPSTSPSPAN